MDEDALDDRDDRREKLVLACDYPGCCMPGWHFPSECHNAEDIERLFACERVDSANVQDQPRGK